MNSVLISDDKLLLAKPQQTLEGHLNDGLSVFQRYWDIYGAVIGKKVRSLGFEAELFSSLLALAVYAHDWGKGTWEWQEYLKVRGRFISHSLFSFVFLADLLGLGKGNWNKSSPAEYEGVLLAVLSHHQLLYTGAFQGDSFRELGSVTYPKEQLTYYQ